MPFLDLPTGARVYYERKGKGPPLILIMGTGLDCSCWRLQVDAYCKHFECISFDNRGTGKTTGNQTPLSVSLMAADTAALIKKLNLGPAHISGLSLGSCIAQELTLNHPELVTTLQLHGTWGRAYGYAKRKFRAQIRLLEKLDLRAFYEINILWFMTPKYMKLYPDKVTTQINQIIQSSPHRDLLKQQYQADLDHDTLDRLPQIKVPSLVTVGSFDLALPPMYGKEVSSAIPNCEFFMFKNGGHLHNIEESEEFNKITLEFLQRHSL